MFKKKAVSLLLALSVVSGGLAACDTTITSASTGPSTSSSSSQTGDKVTVTYMNGETVLKTEQVDSGDTLTRYAPTDGDKYFIDWYATPSFSRIFDFTTAITEDTTIYAAFSVYEEDTTNYYIAGSGLSALLAKSNWGQYIGDDVKLAKSDSDEVNEFAITLDLYANDQFQVISFVDDTAPSWDWQYGFGYLANYSAVSDMFEGSGGLDASTRKSNIKVKMDGNYTVTLNTFPDHVNDSAENAAAKINNVNRLTIVRNGDPVDEPAEYTTDFYIKGAGITAWGDVYNNQTKMTRSADSSTYTFVKPLKEDEEFLFSSRNTNTETGEVSVGTDYIKGDNVDQATLDAGIFTVSGGGNIVAAKQGVYDMTYDAVNKVLSATVDDSQYIEAGKYYINGAIGDHSWDTVFNEDFRLPETEADSFVYTIAGLELAEGDEFIIAKFKADATDPGESWVNQLGTFNYFNVQTAPAAAFAGQADGYGNIVVQEDGIYDISFDAYTSFIGITAAAV